MIEKLIRIGEFKKGSKRQLGIFLGFNEKYAGQRINELIKRQSVTFKTFKKLLEAAELETLLDAAVDLELKKIEKKTR